MSTKVINKLKSYADQIKALKGVEVTTQPLKDLGDTFVLRFAVDTDSTEEAHQVNVLLAKVNRLVDGRDGDQFAQSGTGHYELTYDKLHDDFDLNILTSV
jgi:hypothetical protein